MSKKKNNFIPAFKFTWLTPLFDPFLRLTMGDFTFKNRLVKEISLQEHNRILDLGCGTGTLVILIKQAHPTAEVVGIDADQQILRIAKDKIDKADLDITLNKGMAFDLPYADASFDFVVSSLVFHHLTRDDKKRTLEEIYRLLRPTGKLLIADFGKPDNILMYIVSLFMRQFEEAADNYIGLIPQLISEAGFGQVHIASQYSTLFGTLCFYQGHKGDQP